MHARPLGGPALGGPALGGLFRLALAGTALALAGCAAQTPPVEVTRFHLGQPIAPGVVAVEPRDPAAAQSLEFRAYADAVRTQLTRLGFQTAPAVGQSELVAVVDVNRAERAGPPRPSPFSIGLGGGTFSGGYRGGVGVGGGVSFPIGKRRPNEVAFTEMGVQLKRRSDGTVIWEGRGRTAARVGTPEGDPNATAAKLASALFQGFPGQSGQTITVK